MKTMKREIIDLRTDWISGKWIADKEEEHWGGAGLIVTNKPREDSAGTDSGITWITSASMLSIPDWGTQPTAASKRKAMCLRALSTRSWVRLRTSHMSGMRKAKG